MKAMNLDIHGLARVKVQTNTRHLLGAINAPLSYFCKNNLADSASPNHTDDPIALNLAIGSFDFDTDRCQPVDHKYFVRDRHIAFRESLGGHRFTSMIRFTDRSTDICFAHHRQNFRRFPRMFYADLSAWLYVVVPMLGSLLAQRGWYLLHAAAMERNGQAVLFAGRGGIHKTSIALTLARQGWRFMGDDMVLAGPDGQVACWPVFGERFAYLLAHCADERVPWWRQFDSVRTLRRVGGYAPTADRAALSRVVVLQCRPGNQAITPLGWPREHLLRSVVLSTQMEHLAGPDYKQIIGRFLEAYRFAFPMTDLLDGWASLEPALTESWRNVQIDGFAVPMKFDPDGWVRALALG
jgi:hypothetical protein